MAEHRFKVGQQVRIIPGSMHMSGNGDYKILMLLPPAEGQNQYRVKSVTELFERVVKEGDLQRRA